MPLTTTQLKISDAEYAQRNHRLLETLAELGVTGLVLFDADYIKYYTGFAFIPTERPMAYVINRGGERALFVPRLELEHAQSMSIIDRVAHYLEFPDLNHPMNVLTDLVKDMGIDGKIGADSDGYPWIFGYRGQSLSQLTGSTVINCRAPIEDQMMVKSQAEIALLKESCKWGNLAHKLLQNYTKVGMGEVEVSQRASNEATLMMLDSIGPIWRGNSEYYEGAMAGYRGQIGRNAAIPHALTSNITFQEGDVLVTGASAAIWGYVSELERTMISARPRTTRSVCLITCSICSRSPWKRWNRACPVARSTARCETISINTTSCPTGSTTAGILSACATTKVPSWISATIPKSKRAWSSPWSRDFICRS